jgi:HK97 family phage major capsid protein
MTDVQVLSEPLTYEERSPHSFFRDLVAAKLGEFEARERLDRHVVEQRVNLNTTAGQGGEFTVPAWLVSRFQTAARAGRPLADLIPTLHLPGGISSVNLPRLTETGATDIQATQGSAPTNTDATSSSNASTVRSIAGTGLVSQQLLDQTPIGFDVVTFVDLERDYNAQLENQLLYGTGASGQLLGLTNFTLTAANTVSGAAITTLGSMWPLIGQAGAAVGNGRKLESQSIFMAPRRWEWIASSIDSSNRPIVTPDHLPQQSNFPVEGGLTPSNPVGPINGKPVYLDGAITAGASADQIFLVRYDDMLLFEGDAHTTVNVEPSSGVLKVRLNYYRPVAFIGNTYANHVAIVTALPQPTNF